jgi:hypothetical protein
MTGGTQSLLKRGAEPHSAAVLHELDYVNLLADAQWEGKSIARGSQGTIVDLVDTSLYCEVEFVDPFPCVLTLEKNKLIKAKPASLHSKS